MTIFWQILFWIGIVLAGTVAIVLWWVFAITMVNVIENMMDHFFGNRWRM